MIKMKKTRQLTLITLAIIALAGLPVNTLADRNSIDLKIRFEQAAAKLQKQDYSCLISAQSVLQRLKLGKKIILVDIRNQKEFVKVSIPGAINIPLHFVKSKAFLKSRPLILVDGGYLDRQTEETCKALRHEGFRASILSGGLISWYRQGGPVKGDLLALNRYKNISPLRFYREKNRKDQSIINVSEKQHAESVKLMPNAKHIPVQVSLQTAVSQTEKSILKQNINPIFPVIIFNQTGEQYEPIESIINKAGLKNVYFLKGGLKGYKKFLKHLALSRQPRDSRIKAANRCGNCGPQKENK